MSEGQQLVPIEQRQTQAVAVLPSQGEWQLMMSMCETLVKSGFLLLMGSRIVPKPRIEDLSPVFPNSVVSIIIRLRFG